MGQWVTPSDVKDRWVLPGDFPGTDAQIETKITDAEDLVLTGYPDIGDRIAAGNLRVETVRRIVAGVVIRFFRNPEGIRTTSSTTGPFAVGSTITHGGDEPGELYLSDADRVALSGRTMTKKAFTISTIPKGWP
ncbi:hypothetical protein DFO66_103383 [Brevibacterium sanguinis]|uniref:Gp19/Gp15/Gp42-like protein n=2 Tax=Brevibacterium TaxID=1696 RepID=A0A366INC5_9MICO|nr:MULTISPECIES: hypothetical protein [Brevibacterium]RBP66433.1 hypothetical protein DFO66_103383 [Brevibacterium sanguinis]RBP73085.1 hypothetical protein DFO65_103383 [Brevibacterium celere]